MTIVPAPRINANDDQVGVVHWHVQNGDEVEIGAELVDLETSKAVVTVDATASGRVRQIAMLGAIVRVGVPLCEIVEVAKEQASAAPALVSPPVALLHRRPYWEADGGAELADKHAVVTPAATPLASISMTTVAPNSFRMTRLSQAAAQLVATLDVPADQLQGRGLITRRMLLDRYQAQATADDSASPATPDQGQLMAAQEGLRSQPLPLSKRAEVEALRTGESGLVNSTVSIYFDSALIRERLSREEKFDGNVQPIILYELSRLLRQWPQFTAFFADSAVHFYERIDIGLAIDLGRGLKVLTIKNSDKLMPIEYHEIVTEFGLKYLENKILPSELVDSTITVTDLSSVDILHFKPLINGRQSAIIGIGGDSEQPGHPMCFSMTFDHRVSSGREAGLFLKDLRQRVQSYAPNGRVLRQQDTFSRGSPYVNGPVHCDRCGIDNAVYHRDNLDAVMGAAFSADGEIVAMCRTCAMGYC